MKSFRAVEKNFAKIDAEAAAALIAAAADISLVIDAAGIVRDVAFNNDELAADLNDADIWLGEPWIEQVAFDSRAKVEALLRGDRAGNAQWRHINHPRPETGISIPVLYSAVPLDGGRVVVFGRDLRPLSMLQQRLVDAQRSLERDYSRLRQIETRYRMLFDSSPEAVLVVDATSQKVLEANQSALQMIGAQARRVIGRTLTDLLDESASGPVAALLATVRASGRNDDVQASLGRDRAPVTISASLFRQDDATLFLIRLTPQPGSVVASNPVRAKLLKLVENAPDGFVVTDPSGEIVSANATFLAMVNMPGLDSVIGQPLDRWLGRSGVESEVLNASLRQRGAVRLFATAIRNEQGAPTDVEISAVSISNGGQPCYGFAIRDVARRLTAETRPQGELPRSISQLTELIGRVSLKEVVRETTDVIERLCIETALQMTGDNRASAAEMLGLSRQSLYVKLRRYGIADLAEDAADGSD